MKPIRILIADDHPIFRFGMISLLNSDPDMLVVGEAKSGEEAVTMAAALEPDVILMDINMPGIHGLDATRQISTRFPSISVLMMTMMEDDTVLAALRAGARGYLLKGAEGDETLQAIKTVAAGGSIFSPAITDRVIGFISDPTSRSQRIFSDLTEREYEILRLMVQGLTNTAISERLFISQKTVRNYVSIIFSKLQATSRGEAIAKANEAGVGRKR